MSKFLIDENLPVKVDAWNGSDFEFVSSQLRSESDSELWHYARTNELTIVTKDSDFAYRILSSSPPPRVVHIRFGNMRLRDFKALIEEHWKAVENLSSTHKLVLVFADRIEGVD